MVCELKKRGRHSQVAETTNLTLLVEVIAGDLHTANGEHGAVGPGRIGIIDRLKSKPRLAQVTQREMVNGTAVVNPASLSPWEHEGMGGGSYDNISSLVAVVSVIIGPSHM